jgi:hypothetical protein
LYVNFLKIQKHKFMKKRILLLLLIVSFMGTLSLKADVSQSFKIDEQTGVFSVRFTVVPSATGINGAIGLGGNPVAAWGDFNCILRFADNNVLDAYNGLPGGGGAYEADVVLPYIPNRRYFIQMDIDVPNSKYTIWVTPPGEETVALATDFTFRSNTLTGAINYISTRIVNLDVSIGLLDFQVGTQTPENNHYNFNTQIAPLTGDYSIKLVATPSHDNMDGAFGLSSMKVAAWNNFNAIMQFNTDGTIKAYNSTGYQAITAIPYTAGERYMFLITGSTTTKTYSVDVVSPDGSIATLATDYGIRSNGPAEADGEKVEFIAQRVVQTNHPGAYISIDGVEIGKLGMDGENPTFITAIEKQTGVFSKEFVVVPSMDKVDAVVAFNETDAVLWGGMNAMIQFNQAGLIKIRNAGAYESLVDVPYKALGAYHFKVDFDVATDKYSVSVRSNPQEEAVVIATDYTFRNSAAELNFMVNKSTWASVGVPGGYLTVAQAGIPVSIQTGNNPPTINPVENISFFLPDGSRTIDLTGISDGDGGTQTVTLEATSSDETVATVDVLNFTSGQSTAQLRINAVAIGTATITITVKDDGGGENGEDEVTITFAVEILEWSPVRDLTIRANEGEWGAVNRVLTGNQHEGAYYEEWLTTNTGEARRANDNLIINRDDRFQYAMYIRFDLGQLPEKGAATDGKFQVYTNVVDYDRDSIVLFVLEDYYFPIRDFQGFDDQELDEFYIEGDAGAWTRVYDGTTGNFLPGKEKWITADNAPGFNEGNLVDLGTGWNIYNEDVLLRIGDMHTLLANDSILTIEHEDIAKYITEDENGVIVFVLGKLPQNSWAQRVEVYSNHDLGKEPRISFIWDDNATSVPNQIGGHSFVNVYPNPVKNTLHFSNAENIERAVIYNIQGKAVLNIPVNNVSGSIDISELSKGIYLVEFQGRANNQVSRNKIIVW